MHLPQGERPAIGHAEAIGPDLRRILAPNPSPMTFWGTNTYLLGARDLAVIDPGPDDSAHLAAILRALEPGQRISHIFVTHSHLDHSPLAARLGAQTGAPVLAYGDARAGRSPVMAELAESAEIGGGEGVDHGFAPDTPLCDGQEVTGDGWRLKAHWTPGHFGNHLCFESGDEVFTGDLVMGWASSLVSPPDGDLTHFMASCARLRGLCARRHLPGHGAPIDTPAARLDWLIGHRMTREAAILSALDAGPQTAAQIANDIYTETPAKLLPAATRNVLAHLIDLMQKSEVAPQDTFHANSQFARLAKNDAPR
ncbi:MBL fold metallo-hydrolase [Roseovarius sp.]|uniref:MBL fold metallo-hydrolase n=1 Tax=Roseovarius sp. TaxID=1486281 RepID=UPI00260AEBF9|nr:MBL fold metallo-hydrolase [Roseovarius sp.]